MAITWKRQRGVDVLMTAGGTPSKRRMPSSICLLPVKSWPSAGNVHPSSINASKADKRMVQH